MGMSEFMPTLAMVVLQVGFAGLNVLSKLAMDDGMSPFIMIAYRQVIAAIFLVPVAFFLERKARMEITGKVLFQIFLCSIFGATSNQILYFIGLEYSSPTIACALSNMLPAITFVIAVPFRMESVGIKTMAGQAKVIGTALCVGGSMLMTFYTGSLIKMWPSHIHWRYAEDMASNGGGGGGSPGSQNMAFGAVLVIASCFTWAIWFIVQAKMSKRFSSPYTSSALMCLMASVQCVVIAAGVERKASAWALGWNIRLAASLYIVSSWTLFQTLGVQLRSFLQRRVVVMFCRLGLTSQGLVGSGLAFALMSWCIQRRGPLYVSMFSPLLLVIVAIVGWAFLDEKLYVGSVTGSALIVGGLYLVLWGKGREMKQIKDEVGKDAEVEYEEEAIAAIGLTMLASPPPVSASPLRVTRHGQP